MDQIPLFASVRWTVSDLTRYLRQLFESDEMLRDVWVQGEISNLSRPRSGHIYFTLKDSGASLRGVMWRSNAARLNLDLQDGMAVAVHGQISVYEAGGQYQLYADQIRPVGEGALYQEFLRLKATLEAEGLFDPERKRPIPERPQRIGIVTSATGAALRDMLDTLRRRYPLAVVILAPSPVQGDAAPPKLVAALEGLNALDPGPDVILLARGGGSIEDLWAFNDERVVRAVAASSVPVITGVGHETDFTLVDFASDLRAPTPTAAAELATPVTVHDLRANVTDLAGRLTLAVAALLDRQQADVGMMQSRLQYASPLRRVQNERQRLDELARRLNAAQAHRLDLTRTGLKGLGRRLDALNPQSVLARGYAVVTRQADGRIVSRTAQVAAGDALTVCVSDGTFDVDVK
ncbi:MAG: exodeoxyribonuclease VII large subunit [Chloroflexi bacterium]|nr:exodeoxyribonuclease VII large subunit [Chloroflexota bacterium]